LFSIEEQENSVLKCTYPRLQKSKIEPGRRGKSKLCSLFLKYLTKFFEENIPPKAKVVGIFSPNSTKVLV